MNAVVWLQAERMRGPESTDGRIVGVVRRRRGPFNDRLTAAGDAGAPTMRSVSRDDAPAPRSRGAPVRGGDVSRGPFIPDFALSMLIQGSVSPGRRGTITVGATL